MFDTLRDWLGLGAPDRDLSVPEHPDSDLRRSDEWVPVEQGDGDPEVVDETDAAIKFRVPHVRKYRNTDTGETETVTIRCEDEWKFKDQRNTWPGSMRRAWTEEKFEVVDERPAEPGEWVLFNGEATRCFIGDRTGKDYKILEPVEEVHE